MASEAERVLHAALKLAPQEREQLAEALEQSLAEGTPEEIESAWVEEVHRRVAQIDSGEAKPVSSKRTRRMMAEILERARTRPTG